MTSRRCHLKTQRRHSAMSESQRDQNVTKSQMKCHSDVAVTLHESHKRVTAWRRSDVTLWSRLWLTIVTNGDVTATICAIRDVNSQNPVILQRWNHLNACYYLAACSSRATQPDSGGWKGLWKTCFENSERCSFCCVRLLCLLKANKAVLHRLANVWLLDILTSGDPDVIWFEVHF